MASSSRSRDEWHEFITEFEAGSESVKTFCLRHGLSLSNFYKRRSTRVSASTSAFVAARRSAPPAAPVTVQINEVVIRCDTQTPVGWMSDLVVTLRG